MATTQLRGSTQVKAGTITDTEIAAAAAIASTKLATWSADRNGGGFKLTNLATPTATGDAATKGYVDSVAQGLDVKASCRACADSTITLSGTQTIDGVSLSVGDRVLVKNQGTPATNGIYVVAAGAWTRATDADTSAEVTSGMFTFIEEGTLYNNTGWMLSTDGVITLGSTSLTFVQFSGAGAYTAGAGIHQSGTQFSINIDSLTGLEYYGGTFDGLKVSTDNTTIEIAGGAVAVKAGGIGETQLGSGVYQRTARVITREAPTGSINGSNATFTLLNTPTAGSESVFLNGMLLHSGAGNDYTISGNTITMLIVPATGDRLLVSYRY